SQGVIEAASAQVPTRWRLELLKGAAPPASTASDEVTALLRLYLNADFLLCLKTAQAPALDRDQLLAQGRRLEAGGLATLTAACPLGAGDSQGARELVRALLSRELDQPDLLRKTTPDFQQLADEERQLAQRAGHVSVEFRTEPPGASVRVDGVTRCPAS